MITKAAQDTTNLTRGLTFTRSARSAWELIIRSVEKDRGFAKILLPSYIGFTEREGSGIFDPVQNTKAQYDFYKLNENLSINYESFQMLLNTGEFNIAFVVHYFGLCRNDMQRIKRLCEEHGVILVEDCAHAFQLWLKNEKLGVHGDFAIYSIHKHLATSSGGILRNVSKLIDLLPLPKVDEIMLEPASQLLNSDLEAIAVKRKENFARYIDHLSDVAGLYVMYSTLENEVPQSFPVRVTNGLRETLYFYLIDKGIPTIALYYRLIDELDESNYRQAHMISNEILNLPVHQDITSADIDTITNNIKEFLRGAQ